MAKKDINVKSKTTTRKLVLIYRRLYEAFGPQNWWPGETAFEIMVGAILTQNTAWSNVKKAIINLKREKALTPDKLGKLGTKRLRQLIKPSGFYNIKAGRLENFLDFLYNKCHNKIAKLKKKKLSSLRRELLGISGIGKETADSILLYALQKPTFVIDAYTKRIFMRHKIVRSDIDYDHLQQMFMKNLPRSFKLFNEYHALIVATGKTFCKSRKPLCKKCPLQGV